MGVGTNGRLIITDSDSIEHSNLSQQFLFRDADVGKNKAECATRAALQLSPALQSEYQTARVDDNTGRRCTGGKPLRHQTVFALRLTTFPHAHSSMNSAAATNGHSLTVALKALVRRSRRSYRTLRPTGEGIRT
jgi:hypothetical protein